MATIDDFGDTAEPLNNPPLGGPAGWAAAVRDAIKAANVRIDTALAMVPTGTIVAYAGPTAPSGWHLCDGTAHGSAALSALIGGPLTPDLRGRFPLGSGPSNPLFSAGGEAAVTLTAQTMPGHTHQMAFTTDNDGAGNIGNIGQEADGGTTPVMSIINYAPGNALRILRALFAGGGQPHNNMPPFLALNYIIKK